MVINSGRSLNLGAGHMRFKDCWCGPMGINPWLHSEVSVLCHFLQPGALEDDARNLAAKRLRTKHLFMWNHAVL